MLSPPSEAAVASNQYVVIDDDWQGSGYNAKTLPGVREAVDAGNSQLAQEMANRLEASLLTIVEGLREALDEAQVAPYNNAG